MTGDDWKNRNEAMFYSWVKEKRKNTKPVRVSGEVKKALFQFLNRGHK